MIRPIITIGIAGIIVVFAMTAAAQNTGKVMPPGVMTTITPTLETGPFLPYSELVSRHDIPELLAGTSVAPEFKEDIRFDPEYWAKDIRFAAEKWMLEFSFKPMRMVWVDFPNRDGKMDRKLVWYLVYSVKNTGNTLRTKLTTPYSVNEVVKDEADKALDNLDVPGLPDLNIKGDRTPAGSTDRTLAVEVFGATNRGNDGLFETEAVATPIKFVPRFIFVADRIILSSGSTLDRETATVMVEAKTDTKSYPDQVLPLAIGAIQRRENVGVPLLNSVSIAKEVIQSGETLWGVATWVDVDPRVDVFSVYVGGLTNSYRWADPEMGTPVAFKKGDTVGTGRQMVRKTLKLNFWRPGDEFDQNEKEIRFGRPGVVDYEWVFR